MKITKVNQIAGYLAKGETNVSIDVKNFSRYSLGVQDIESTKAKFIRNNRALENVELPTEIFKQWLATIGYIHHIQQ